MSSLLLQGRKRRLKKIEKERLVQVLKVVSTHFTFFVLRFSRRIIKVPILGKPGQK